MIYKGSCSFVILVGFVISGKHYMYINYLEMSPWACDFHIWEDLYSNHQENNTFSAPFELYLKRHTLFH